MINDNEYLKIYNLIESAGYIGLNRFKNVIKLLKRYNIKKEVIQDWFEFCLWVLELRNHITESRIKMLLWSCNAIFTAMRKLKIIEVNPYTEHRDEIYNYISHYICNVRKN